MPGHAFSRLTRHKTRSLSPSQTTSVYLKSLIKVFNEVGSSAEKVVKKRGRKPKKRPEERKLTPDHLVVSHKSMKSGQPEHKSTNSVAFTKCAATPMSIKSKLFHHH